MEKTWRGRRAKQAPDVLAPYLDRPQTERQPFTQVPDWVILCDAVPVTAFRLWCVLRSMQFEQGPGIPPLNLDEVCWLLPGVGGKPTSKARAREALDCLLLTGLLKDVSAPGTGKAARRLYLAFDEPVIPVQWKSARGKLARYTRLWRRGPSGL